MNKHFGKLEREEMAFDLIYIFPKTALLWTSDY